jgi:hypothetical protein
MLTAADIPSDAPEDQIFYLDGGIPVRTGMLMSETKEIPGLMGFADRIGVMTKDEIAKTIANPKRKAGRKLFDTSWIRNQGRRGSCAAYSGCSALEKTIFIRGGERVKLGPEFVYSHVNGGRDSGAQLKHVVQHLEKIGCPPSDFVKYESFRKSEQSPEAFANAGRFKLLEGEYFGVYTEEEMATAIALNFICYVACHVTGNWMRLDGNGVVNASDGPGNHAIHCDDVRINSQGEYEFDHPGSWGLNYGQQGRGWTTWRRHYRGPVRNHQFVAMRAAISDPNGLLLPKKQS